MKLNRPSRSEAEAAIRTVLSYIGDDPDREGLIDTPKRVISAYDEWFDGYNQDPESILGRTFEDVGGYNDIVLMRDIKIESHCEHHIAPILGKAHIAYLPGDRVVGISKLVRLVDVFAKRLQSQETLTEQIAQTINNVLKPRGVAVIMSTAHQCLTTRGVHKDTVACVTRTYLGAFKEDRHVEQQLRDLLSL
ncbi:MAG: GTP cyclohydrolase I FolE [Pseudomonadota bacterium]